MAESRFLNEDERALLQQKPQETEREPEELPLEQELLQREQWRAYLGSLSGSTTATAERAGLTPGKLQDEARRKAEQEAAEREAAEVAEREAAEAAQAAVLEEEPVIEAKVEEAPALEGAEETTTQAVEVASTLAGGAGAGLATRRGGRLARSVELWIADLLAKVKARIQAVERAAEAGERRLKAAHQRALTEVLQEAERVEAYLKGVGRAAWGAQVDALVEDGRAALTKGLEQQGRAIKEVATQTIEALEALGRAAMAELAAALSQEIEDEDAEVVKLAGRRDTTLAAVERVAQTGIGRLEALTLSGIRKLEALSLGVVVSLDGLRESA